MTTIRIDRDKFLSNHPSPGNFRKVVPDWPTSDAYKETCCGQVSHAFNASAEPIENYEYPDKYSHTGKARAFYSKRNRAHYLLAVHDVHAYLMGRYGEPASYRSKQEFLDSEGTSFGLLAFGYRHIDVWNYGRIHFQSIYNMSYLWNSSHWGGQKLMFWQVGEPRPYQPSRQFDDHLGFAGAHHGVGT